MDSLHQEEDISSRVSFPSLLSLSCSPPPSLVGSDPYEFNHYPSHHANIVTSCRHGGAVCALSLHSLTPSLFTLPVNTTKGHCPCLPDTCKASFKCRLRCRRMNIPDLERLDGFQLVTPQTSQETSQENTVFNSLRGKGVL